MPVARWYDEISMHDFEQEYQEETGHFTQIVWKNSKEIGFGVAYSDEEIFIVAQYVSLYFSKSKDQLIPVKNIKNLN